MGLGKEIEPDEIEVSIERRHALIIRGYLENQIPRDRELKVLGKSYITPEIYAAISALNNSITEAAEYDVCSECGKRLTTGSEEALGHCVEHDPDEPLIGGTQDDDPGDDPPGLTSLHEEVAERDEAVAET